MLKKTQKSTLLKNTSSFHSKSKRPSSTPKKSKTTMINIKPSLNNSSLVISPTSTVHLRPKHQSPFDLVVPLETSFNRLICKQNSAKPSPQKQSFRFDQEMREIFNRSQLAAKNDGMDLIKEFLMESNKLFYDHLRKENKKMKTKLKQQLYEYIQGIKKEIMENMKDLVRTELTPKSIEEMKNIIKQLNTTIIQQKFKIQEMIFKTSEQIHQTNTKQLQRIDESILIFNQKLEQYSSMVKMDFFGSFSDRLSEVIEKYNENFSTMNDNVDVMSELITEIVSVMKYLTKNKKLEKGGKMDTEQSPFNKTAKFNSIEI